MGRGDREGGRRERGGRVRLRGGNRMQRRRDESDDEDEDDDDDDDDDDDEDDDSEDDQQHHRRHKDQRHRRKRRRTEDEEEDDEDEDSSARELDGEDEEMEDVDEDDEDDDNRSDEDTEPPVLLVSDLSDDLLNGSYLTVTLQRPPRAKRHPGSIVPKLEAAMSPRAHGPGYVQRKTLGRTRHRDSTAGNGLAQPAKNPVGRPPRHRASNPHDRERETASSSSDSSASPAPPSRSSQSPSSLLSLPSFKEVGNEEVGEKEVWVAVFRYLSRAELAGCMTVCKAWYKWSCDKRLWSSVDVSRRTSLSTQALQGIIKRQPASLDLSWTPVSKKQITLLIHRLPGLKELKMIGCSWSSMSALSTPSLPCLRALDLRWAEGVKDSQIRDLVTPPGSDGRSRLRGCTVLRLAGLDVSDSTLRLILRHMPLLESLDLAHCKDLSDQSVCLLTSAGTHTRNTLTEIVLAGCNKLTDSCLAYLKRAPSLELLDLRGCKAVTPRACEAFISDLSHCALFCMMEEKLIQRIS